tara:strand:- start:1474 stop:1896 length:423 start_codon:yes stop_codon:yes gene_type:complete
MTLSSPLNTQPLELESTTTLESQLQQRQSLAAIGQRYTDIVWAAGLFEGEGSICTKKQIPKHRYLKIGMTDKDVMQRFVNVIGYGNLNGPYKGTNKPFWAWEVSKKTEVLRILKMFLPHFGKRRAEKAIEAINHLNETTY